MPATYHGGRIILRAVEAALGRPLRLDLTTWEIVLDLPNGKTKRHRIGASGGGRSTEALIQAFS